MKRPENAAGLNHLELRNVSRVFSDTAGVHNIHFAVEAGEIVCLLGPSGCGKSTTLRLAAGVERLDAGTIHIGGEIVDGQGRFVPPELRRIGLMFQDYALFPHMNVLANVMFGLSRLAAPLRAENAKAALARVGLSHLAEAWPHTLSGGEQQRAALARALAPEPRVMMMDEPFSGLDGRLREAVRTQAVEVLRATKTATLFVTHDPDEALRTADRIILMRAGRIAQIDTPENIFRRPVDRDAAAFFSPVNVLTGVVARGAVATVLGPVSAGGMADGQRVEIVIRHDDLHTADSAPGAALATISTCSPGIGGHVVEVDIGGQRLTLRHDGAVTPGSQMGILASQDRVMVFPA